MIPKRNAILVYVITKEKALNKMFKKPWNGIVKPQSRDMRMRKIAWVSVMIAEKELKKIRK